MDDPAVYKFQNCPVRITVNSFQIMVFVDLGVSYKCVGIDFLGEEKC